MSRPTRRPRPQKNGERVVTSVKIRADLHSRARHYSVDHKLTLGEVLDEALEKYLQEKRA